LKNIFDEAIRTVLTNPSRGGAGGGGGGSRGNLGRSLKGTFSKLGKGIKEDIESIISALLPQGEEAGVSVKDRTFKTRLGLKVGDIHEAKSGLRVFYEREPDSTRQGDVEIALSFSVKDGVDPFSLGELSGSVKQILSLAKNPDFKYDLKTGLAREGDGTQIYTLTMVWHEEAAFAGAQKVVDFYSPKVFEVKLDLNQSPSVPTDEFICANFSLNSEVSRDLVRFGEAVMTQGMNESDKRMFSLLRASRNFVFETEFDNVQELYRKAFSELPEELHILGWSTLPTLLHQAPLGKLLHDPKTPEPARTTYEKLSYLKGFHGARIKAGHHALKVEASHLEVFSLLPSLKDLAPAADNDD